MVPLLNTGPEGPTLLDGRRKYVTRPFRPCPIIRAEDEPQNLENPDSSPGSQKLFNLNLPDPFGIFP